MSTKKRGDTKAKNFPKPKDNFVWLENDFDSKVKSWVEKQNKLAYSKLKNSSYLLFKKELQKLHRVTNFTEPLVCGDYYFFEEKKSGEDQYSLLIQKNQSSVAKTLIKPKRSRENIESIDFWYPSQDGKYVAYGLSQNGSELSTLHIKKTADGKFLREKIPNCRYSNICWLSDNSGFYYTRNVPPKNANDSEKHLYEKVFFHKIGLDYKHDEMIFGNNRPKDDMINISLSKDDKCLAIETSQDWSSSEIYIYTTNENKITPVITGKKNKFSPILLKERMIIYTNYQAPNGRVLMIDLKSVNKQKIDCYEIIKENKNRILQSINVTENNIILEYSKNAYSEMVICDHLGKNKKNIKLPKYSSLMSVTTNKKEKDFFYSLTSFTFPQIVYKYNSIKNISLVFRATDNPINPKDYVAKQHWTTSQDGTRIPVFLFHKKGLKLNGDNPLILEGYGGFGVSLGPGFMRSWIPWLERGGIIATAIIRGGGEFGEKWHLQGIQQNKEKSFEDFIAINKFLIKKNYTSIEKIGSIGASNGGLLVTATAIKHPRLFKAVCALVPLTDMVKFHKFGIGIRWINEYGDPRNKKDLKNILKWSPYHNTKSKIKYPDFLFITAQQDSRVPSLHARKMTAILQKNNMSNTFLITEKNVGHGPGKPLDKIIEEQSMVLSFLTEQLKLLV